jgi:hypothetical protein
VGIIRRLPFYETSRELEIGGKTFFLLRHQIMLCVSVAHPGIEELPDKAKRIPAILDTGCNGEFVLQSQHLRDAQVSPEHLELLDPHTSKRKVLSNRKSGYLNGCPVVTCPAAVWLHRNIPGKHVWDQAHKAMRINLNEDIRITTGPRTVRVDDEEEQKEEYWPRLPLLGMAALANANVQVRINFRHKYVSISCPCC